MHQSRTVHLGPAKRLPARQYTYHQRGSHRSGVRQSLPVHRRLPACVWPRVRRSPAHCIEYAHLILWGNVRTGEEFDADNEEHMRWVFERATERAAQYGIQVRAWGPRDRQSL